MQTRLAITEFALSMAEHFRRDKFCITELLIPAVDHIFEGGGYYLISGNRSKGWIAELGTLKLVSLPYFARTTLASLLTRPELRFSKISKVVEGGKKKWTDSEVLEFVERKATELGDDLTVPVREAIARFADAVKMGPVKKERSKNISYRPSNVRGFYGLY